MAGLFDGAATTILAREEMAGLRLAVGRLLSDVVVLDDLVTGRRLGTVDLISPFAFRVGHTAHILIGGTTDNLRGGHGSASEVVIEWPNAVETIVPTEGVWLTALRPFTPGVSVKVRWLYDDHELRFTTVGPWQESDLAPHRAGWTTYAAD